MKLNLGCGNKRKEGFIGVDKFQCDAVDQLADLNKPLPFDESSIEEIWMDNVIEHVQDIPAIMAEVYRICENDAKVTILTPHFSSLSSWVDPTHLHHLSYFSMDHFERQKVSHYTGGGFKVTSRKLSFGGGLMGLMGRLFFKINAKNYESKWCFIFRASTLRFELTVSK